MKGKVIVNGNELTFEDPREVSFLVNGKTWKLSDTDFVLPFRGPRPVLSATNTASVPSGSGFYLKQWRKRRLTGRKATGAGKGTTQTEAARVLGVKQSFICKIERGKREMNVEMWQRVRKDLLDHGRERFSAE